MDICHVIESKTLDNNTGLLINENWWLLPGAERGKLVFPHKIYGVYKEVTTIILLHI